MQTENKPKVAIIMGSDSDLKVMKEAAIILEEFNVSHSVSVMSAHRTPDRSMEFARSAAEQGIKVIIAGAGGAAHLAGVMGALTHLPVIGVPIQSKSLNGLDSLLSIVQMPAGIPVATVAIDGARNAGLLAVQMLALNDATLSEKLIAYKNKLKNSVNEKAKDLEEMGWKKYMKE